MALRMICSTCNGRGYILSYRLFKRNCLVCKGTGLFVEQDFGKIRRGKTLNKKV